MSSTCLSAAEMQLIAQDWALATRDRKAFGTAVFMRMFESHPEMQAMFSHFKGKPLSQLAELPMLKAHGLRVVNTLDAAIREQTAAAAAADANSVSAETLRLIGESHSGRGVQLRHFEALNQVLAGLLQDWLADGRFAAHRDVWRRFLDGILPLIGEGLARAVYLR